VAFGTDNGRPGIPHDCGKGPAANRFAPTQLIYAFWAHPNLIQINLSLLRLTILATQQGSETNEEDCGCLNKMT
jgi:hypothetical protein